MISHFRTIKLLVLLIFLAIAISACKSKTTVNIGFLSDLTEKQTHLGVPGKNAVLLAIDEYNKKSKKFNYNLNIKNDKCNTDQIEYIFHEFNSEKTNLIIGPYSAKIAEKLSKNNYFDSMDYLFVSPIVTSDKFMGKKDGFFSVASKNSEQGKLLAQDAVEKGVKKVAIVCQANKIYYYQAMLDSFTSLIENNNGEVVYYKYYLDNEFPNFEKIAKEIIHSDAEAVLSVSGAYDSAELFQYIRKENQKIRFFLSMEAKTEEFIYNGGKAVEGSIIASVQEDKDNLEFGKFLENYKKLYGENPNFSAVCSYQATIMLLEAIEKNGSTEPATIKKYFEETLNFKEISMDFTINENGDSIRPYTLYRVENGQYIRVIK